MKPLHILLIFCFFANFFFSNKATATTSTNYQIPFDNMASGGGDVSSSANYKIRDSFGQNVVGATASAGYETGQGYRYGDRGNVLDVAFVDGFDAVLVAPIVGFSAVAAGNTASGTLGMATAKIRVTNTRGIASWSLTLAATNGPTSFWQSNTTLDFNDPGSAGALTVNPASGSITTACTTSNLTLGPAATFNQGVTDSVTLLSAGAGADLGCNWDLTGIPMTQTVPATQPAGNYVLAMTVTIS